MNLAVYMADIPRETFADVSATVIIAPFYILSQKWVNIC